MFTQDILEKKVKADLIAIAKEMSIKGRSLLKKEQLIQRIISAQEIIKKRSMVTTSSASLNRISQELIESTKC